MSEHLDNEGVDAARHSAYVDHTNRATDAASSPRPGRAGLFKKLTRRLADAASPRQPEFNVESSAALLDLQGIIERFDLRIGALEQNSTELWGAIGPSGGNSATKALFASHDLLLEDMAEQLGHLQKAADALRDDIQISRSAVERAAGQTQELAATVGQQAATIDQRIDTSNRVLQSAINDARDLIDRLSGDVGNSNAKVEILLHEFRAAPELVTRTASEAHDVRISEIYARFEDRFRGSREQVMAMLKDYESDIERLGKFGRVLDMGSGRGEWLEVLGENGIDAYGVDTSPTFVEQAKNRGHEVIHADVIDHLGSLPEGSLGAITGFHIAEHLPVPTLIELLDRCLVSLAPGGRLLLETPNPTNILVGAANFYLDPTHLRPLHPDLLSFLVADRGFVDVEIRYLHPQRPDFAELDSDSSSDVERSMRWAMFGPQDVAVLATKPGGGTT